MIELVIMEENPYEQIDDLFVQIRLRLAILRQSDSATTEELKGLVTQLEDWVESLVVDSLKLRNLESGSDKATESEKRRRNKPGR